MHVRIGGGQQQILGCAATAARIAILSGTHQHLVFADSARFICARRSVGHLQTSKSPLPICPFLPLLPHWRPPRRRSTRTLGSSEICAGNDPGSGAATTIVSHNTHLHKQTNPLLLWESDGSGGCQRSHLIEVVLAGQNAQHLGRRARPKWTAKLRHSHQRGRSGRLLDGCAIFTDWRIGGPAKGNHQIKCLLCANTDVLLPAEERPKAPAGPNLGAAPSLAALRIRAMLEFNCWAVPPWWRAAEGISTCRLANC